jgi:hypothetical protein
MSLPGSSVGSDVGGGVGVAVGTSSTNVAPDSVVALGVGVRP